MEDDGGTDAADRHDEDAVRDPSGVSDRMHRLLHLLPEGVLLVDRSGRIVEANHHAAQIIGEPADRLRGSEVSRFHAGAFRADRLPFLEAERPVRQVLLSGVPQTGVVMGITRTGNVTQWLELNVIPVGSVEDDGPVVLVSFRDVTAERTAHQAVVFQAGLLDATAEAIIAIDPDLRITYCNASAEDLLQVPRSEAVGAAVSSFIASAHQGDVARIEELLRSGLVIRDFESVVRRSDGTEMNISVSVSTSTDAQGVDQGAIAIIRDITEQVRVARVTEAAAHRAAEAERMARLGSIERDAAIRANLAKNDFLSRMSHELRTPLTAVLGFGQLLEMAELPDEGDRRSVAQILQAGRHLLDLIDEVLDIARIEGGNLPLTLEAVSLREVLAGAVDLTAPAAARRNITTTVVVPDGEVMVHADQQRLLQVMLNLVSNAIKYNVDGGSVSVEASRTTDGLIRVAVSDTGRGIPAESFERLFVPFDRLGAEATTIEGTGVGLSLSRALIQGMGGTLDVSSTVGQGSRFSFQLSLAADPTPAIGTSVQGPVPGDQPLTILFIEDDLPNIERVETLLGRRGNVRLVSARRGRQGIALARQHRPDLVLLDAHLRDIDARDVLADLQTHPATEACCVMVISEQSGPDGGGRTRRERTTDDAPTSFDLDRLLTVVDGLVQTELEVVPS